jgi:Protein of unknown function (DUF2630)
MDSKAISEHIEELVAEEHRLLERGEVHELDTQEHARLAEVNVQLDRYYDLLRQRRAREEFAQDTSSARLRSGETVEKYLQ